MMQSRLALCMEAANLLASIQHGENHPRDLLKPLKAKAKLERARAISFHQAMLEGEE